MWAAFSDRVFRDRQEASRVLAGLPYREDVVVPGLPRGGVPVASEQALIYALVTGDWQGSR
jgi:predicted phosphoribosyltransferase